ncbi:MAG: thiamine pyrophosphate-dependent dehydrogenase E1 component subunit alpha [Leucobacter sp.]
MTTVETEQTMETQTAPSGTAEDRRRAVLAQMIRSRVFEERLGEEFAAQREHAKQAYGGRNSAFEDYNAEFRIPIQGNIELSIGQEAGPAAVCAWLDDDDYAAGTHRSHSLALAKGVPEREILAEIYGKETGLCGGRGGDFMLNDPRVNFENSAIMAQLTGVALGFAFAAKRRGTASVATVFVGDGASNQGIVHEAMNLAAVWKLPMIFAIEDNGYAISTESRATVATGDLSRRGLAYGIPSARVADRDTDRLIDEAGSAVERARSGEGPSLIVIDTNRLRGAFEGDNQSYRPDGELDTAAEQDALPVYQALLLSEGVVSREWIDEQHRLAQAVFDEALAFAESSPFPSAETAMEGVFA